MSTQIEKCRELVQQGYVLTKILGQKTVEGEKYTAVYCHRNGDEKSVLNVPEELVAKSHLKPEYARRTGVTRIGKTQKKRAKEAEARERVREVEKREDKKKTPEQRAKESAERAARIAAEKATREASCAKKVKGKK